MIHLSRPRLLRWVIGLAAAAALLLVTGELVARYGLGLGTPPLVVVHPSIEYMFAPDQDLRRFGTRQFYNRFGMRTENFSDAKADGEFRVMVFGDSVINGGSLTDHTDLATSIAKRELEAKGRFSDVTVGNISAGTWGPGNLLAYSQTFGFFDADLVVLVLSSHDYNDNPTFEPLDPSTHPTEPPPLALVEGLQRYLPRYLPNLARGGPADPAADFPLEPSDAGFEDAHHGLADLRQLLTKSREAGAGVAVIQYLNTHEVQSGELEPGYSAIRGLCEELGVPVYSTENVFREKMAAGESPFRDSIHPNDSGQRLLGRVLLEAMRSHLASRADGDTEADAVR